MRRIAPITMNPSTKRIEKALHVKKYLAAIGAKGGASGRGKSKARSREQARKAAQARWTKAKLVKKEDRAGKVGRRGRRTN